MHDFLLKELSNTDIEQELENIGFDKTYVHKAASKFYYKNFKIFNLTIAQANILKQTALTTGADCGTHREVITGKKELSDCILGGSYSQLGKIAKKLQLQPFGLKTLGQMIEQKINVSASATKIMGVLNLTTNSFSDGGEYFDFENSVKHLYNLIDEGADIIDIGAESTKPYSNPVSPEEQLEKLEPILKYLNENNIQIPISIDTRSAKVAGRCIELGAGMVNDVSGFDFDSALADVISDNPGVKVVLQHSNGTPETMQDNPHYENLTDEIFISLKNKVDFAISKGVRKENIIIDPGIGFGKTKSHNMEILKRWQEFKTIGCPVLIGLSRKSLLDMSDASNEEKDIYTLALNSILMREGVDYIRVHNVKIHRKLLDILN